MTEDDCPVFCLRATDKLAPTTIAMWVAQAKFAGVGTEKIASAQAVLDAAREWQRTHKDRVKVAD